MVVTLLKLCNILKPYNKYICCIGSERDPRFIFPFSIDSFKRSTLGLPVNLGSEHA